MAVTKLQTSETTLHNSWWSYPFHALRILPITIFFATTFQFFNVTASKYINSLFFFFYIYNLLR